MAGKYKRIYIAAGTSLIGLFSILTLIGLQIVDTSGDIICAGTFDDPCVSYFDVVNPTAKSVYIYNYDEVQLNFSPEIKDYELYVLYYGKWHYTNFTMETRLGNIPKDRKYSFVFPRYSTKHFKLVGYKNNPTDNIKWGVGTSGAYLDPVWYGTKEKKYKITHKVINGKKAVEIKFTDLKKEYKIKEESEKLGKTPKELLNVKKTKYYGDVDIKLMQYVNVTENVSYDCNCVDKQTLIIVNGTNHSIMHEVVCDTCYKAVTTEVFQEIDPETFILKNNEPIYEVMGKATKFEKTDNGWGYAVWTDVNIMDIEIEGATWWNSTFLKKKEIRLQNHSENIEVSNYSMPVNVTYDSDMQNTFVDLMFTNGSEDTVLSHWIESKVDGNWAHVWFKIPYTLSNTTNTSIYMYYDNASVVSSESDIKTAFLVGDDFNDNSYDTDMWTTHDYGGTITVEETGQQLKISTSGATNYGAVCSDYDAGSVMLDAEGWMSITGASVDNEEGGLGIKDSASIWGDGILIRYGYTSGSLRFRSYYGPDGTTTDTPSATTINYLRTNVLQTGHVTYYKRVGTDTTWQTHQTHTWVNPFSSVRKLCLHHLESGSGNGVQTYFDDVRMRMYLPTTPTYSFGAEEEPTAINYSTIACRTLDQAYGYYWLNTSIADSTYDKCMNITANHITLDCQSNTIDGEDNDGYYGIWINRDTQQTTNITIKNCIITDWARGGIDIEYADYNNITNCTLNSNGVGAYLYLSDYNNFTDVTGNSNDQDAIEIELSSHNVFSNNTYDSNSDTGIYLMYNSTYNIIANSTIKNNTDYGIQIVEDPTGLDATNNTFYNNLLNNTINLFIDDADYVGTIYLNTTNQTGTREYSSGSNIGGNFWAYPNGTGYSETCADFDEDYFCDTAYTLYSGAIDYLPYTNTEISDFDITESTGTLFYFYAYQPIQSEIEPYGQTSTVGMFTLDNNLTYIIDIYAKLNETTTGVTLKLNDEYDYDSAVSITDSYQLIYEDLAVSGTGYIWAWADFDNLLTQWDPELEIVGVG